MTLTGDLRTVQRLCSSGEGICFSFQDRLFILVTGAFLAPSCNLKKKRTDCQGSNRGVLPVSGVLKDARRPRVMHDVMFEFTCDRRRFAVKRFNVGLRKR